MNRSVVLLATVAALIVAGLGVAVFADEDEKKEKKERKGKATEALAKLAEDVDPAAPDASRKRAEELARKYELESLMKAARMRGKGHAGLEARLRELSRKELSGDDLTSQADEITRMGRVTLALGLVVEARTPRKNRGDATPEEWKGYAKEMQSASATLIQAVKAADVKKVKKAAARVNTSCSACHSSFRTDD